MPLFSGPFVYDTETDLVEGYDEPITVTIQMCPADAVSEDDVVVLEGLDCFDRFLNLFEETKGKTLKCSVFNLDYEWKALERHVLSRYRWFEQESPKQRMSPGQFHVVGDDRMIYQVELVNRHGCHLKITDDWQRTKKAMKKVAGDVFSEHPDWWPEGTTKDDVKLDIDESWYNSGWSDPTNERHDIMLRYAVRDSFSQAMILRNNINTGRSEYLTSSSAGMGECLIRTYGSNTKDREHWNRLKLARDDFRKRYPPLNREMQDMVEGSLLGGFVYGVPGVVQGPLVHIDFKSSYPRHYSKETSFYGAVSVVNANSPRYERVLENPNFFRWYVVSFRFDGLKEGGMPVFSGKECWFPEGRPPNCWNHKMKSGVIHEKLFTEEYLAEIQEHVNVSELVIHEVWFAKKRVGEFSEFINEEYAMKEICKAKGEEAEASMHKDNMNGGVHGKTITKTHRKSLTYRDGVKEYVEVLNDPDYCSLIGFTGMMNRRSALLKACRMVQQSNHPVLMCDTDSIVTKATEAEIRQLFGDMIAEDLDVKGMLKEGIDEQTIKDRIVDTLGKFELERNKKNGRVEFDEFRCWGLKRYLELDNGQYRKSAFAGMDRDIQKDILMDFPVDGTVRTWTQKGSKNGKYVRLIVDVTKSAKMEDIWFRPMSEVPKKVGLSIEGLKHRASRVESVMNMDWEVDE